MVSLQFYDVTIIPFLREFERRERIFSPPLSKIGSENTLAKLNKK